MKLEADQEDQEILARLGGDPRVMELFSLALTAYEFLPAGLLNLKTGKPTRSRIIETFESFGFRVAPIPWERFPKRFHKNRPLLQLFKEPLSDAEIEQYWVDLIAAQTPEPPPKKRRRGPANPPDGGVASK